MVSPLAALGGPGMDLAGALLAFGADWLWFLGPCVAVGLALLVLARRAPAGQPFLRRMSAGAAAVTGLPAWCAGGLVLSIAAMLIAVQGFFWDVGWHIAIGRDEFLLSPPHLSLLAGISLIGIAGAVSTAVATRDGAAVGWRVDRWRVPYGAAALLLSGGAAIVGFGVDELWHTAYGLDVTMWSPPHLVMVSAGGFTPISAWLLLAEAGPHAGRRRVCRPLATLLAGAVLVGLSVWQLELDFGLSQWPTAYHPILVAAAAGFALTAARAALGRGGALVAMAVFVAIRAVLAALTVLGWGLTLPRFLPYAGAALAVEAAFGWRAARPGGLRPALLAGLGVATVGLASAWGATALWGWQPWQIGLLPWMPLAALGALGAAVLGTGFGRAVSHRPAGLPSPAVALGVASVCVALASPLPRLAPEGEVTIRTSPAAQGADPAADVEADAGGGRVRVEVEPSDAAAAELLAGADRREVIAWQGGGFATAALVPIGGDRYATEVPLPVGGDWKTLVRAGSGRVLGAAAVAMPADPEIGAGAIPLTGERTAPLVPDVELMLRERTEGPAWPGIVGYAFTGASLALVLGLQLAGAVGLERRRRREGTSRLEQAGRIPASASAR